MLTTETLTVPPPNPDNFYLCYRCLRCARLITKLEMLEWRAANGGKGRPNLCPCGAVRISATNPTDEELLRLCTFRQLVRTLLGRRDVMTRLWLLRLAVFSSPPLETRWQWLLSPWLRRLGIPTVLPPPPPPTQEDIEFAEKAKLAVRGMMEDRIQAVAASLAADDIPLDETLVRGNDEEMGR